LAARGPRTPSQPKCVGIWAYLGHPGPGRAPLAPNGQEGSKKGPKVVKTRQKGPKTGQKGCIWVYLGISGILRDSTLTKWPKGQMGGQIPHLTRHWPGQTGQSGPGAQKGSKRAQKGSKRAQILYSSGNRGASRGVIFEPSRNRGVNMAKPPRMGKRAPNQPTIPAWESERAIWAKGPKRVVLGHFWTFFVSRG
jgi:hypothetical protein